MNDKQLEIYNSLHNFLEKEIFRELCSNIFRVGITHKIEGIDCALGTHPGLKRKRNEDRLAVGTIRTPGDSYFFAILCDGVGGTEFGDIAASLAITFIISHLSSNFSKNQTDTKVKDGVLYADKNIQDRLLGKGATTLSLFITTSSEDICALNIGDSRIYSWEPINKKFRQISNDDTIENEMEKLNIKDKSALEALGLKGTLSQSLGEENRDSNELNFVFYDKNAFDEGFVLVSDGAWKDSGNSFDKVISNATNSIDAVRRTLALATWCGGSDNSSIIASAQYPKLPIESINTNHSLINLIIGENKLVFFNTTHIKNEKKRITKPRKPSNNTNEGKSIEKEISIEPVSEKK